jgi:hypothetical protein
MALSRAVVIACLALLSGACTNPTRLASRPAADAHGDERCDEIPYGISGSPRAGTGPGKLAQQRRRRWAKGVGGTGAVVARIKQASEG